MNKAPLRWPRPRGDCALPGLPHVESPPLPPRAARLSQVPQRLCERGINVPASQTGKLRHKEAFSPSAAGIFWSWRPSSHVLLQGARGHLLGSSFPEGGLHYELLGISPCGALSRKDGGGPRVPPSD